MPVLAIYDRASRGGIIPVLYEESQGVLYVFGITGLHDLTSVYPPCVVLRVCVQPPSCNRTNTPAVMPEGGTRNGTTHYQTRIRKRATDDLSVAPRFCKYIIPHFGSLVKVQNSYTFRAEIAQKPHLYFATLYSLSRARVWIACNARLDLASPNSRL